MDDGRIGDEMTLAGIAKQLAEIREDIAGVKTDVAGLKTDVAGVKTDGSSLRGEFASLRSEMREGFNASKVRDEELRSIAKLGLEAHQGLLETTTARFDATDKKHDEAISLLKAAVRGKANKRPPRRT